MLSTYLLAVQLCESHLRPAIEHDRQAYPSIETEEDNTVEHDSALDDEEHPMAVEREHPSPVEPRLLMHLPDYSTPLLACQVPLPFDVDVEADEDDVQARSTSTVYYSPPEFLEEAVAPARADHEWNVVPDSTIAHSTDPPPRRAVAILGSSNLNAASTSTFSALRAAEPRTRRFSITLPPIPEAVAVPLPSDSDSDSSFGDPCYTSQERSRTSSPYEHRPSTPLRLEYGAEVEVSDDESLSEAMSPCE